MNWAKPKNIPNITANADAIPRLPRPKRGMRNRDGSSIGCSLRRSAATQALPSSTDVTALTSIRGSVQPYSGPCTRANTRAARAPAESRPPRGSMGCLRESREDGTKSTVRTKRVTAIGMFTKKMQPHQKNSRSTPAARMPIAPPAPANPAQMAMALLRSSAGNTVVRMDRVAGMTRPAPTPIRQRQAMIWAAESLVAPRTAPVSMMPRPTRRAPRRPNRSPRAPAGRSIAASIRA